MSFKNKNKTVPSHPVACQYPIGNNEKCGLCGETQTLAIIKEFRELYENRLQQIDADACGDCISGLQAKLELQQQWIKDLTEQNEMLVRTVEQLENEATLRVVMLEEKLQNTAKTGSEVMQKYREFSYSINLDEALQKWLHQQSDINNLLKFIKRVRDEYRWNTDGLTFYNVTQRDLLGELCEETLNKRFDYDPNSYKCIDLLKEKKAEVEELKMASLQEKNEEIDFIKKVSLKQKNDELEEVKKAIRQEKEEEIEQIRRVSLKQKNDEIEEVKKAIRQEKEQEIEQIRRTSLQGQEDLEALKGEKNEELEKIKEVCRRDKQESVNELRKLGLALQEKSNEIEELKRSMRDMRNALTIEVAEKHDTILNLRREVQQLEEQCRQANKQTQFKDDIIKELRKEIKLLKVENNKQSADKCGEFMNKVEELQQQIETLKKAVFVSKRQLEDMEIKSVSQESEKEEYMRKHKLAEELAVQLEKNLEGERHTFTEKQKEYERIIADLKNKVEVLQRFFEGSGYTIEECINILLNYPTLQTEMETLKKEHRRSLDQVISLNAENRAQNEAIYELQESLKANECIEIMNKSSAAAMTVSSSDLGKDEKRYFDIRDLETQLDMMQKEKEIERATWNQEIYNLKQTILELEKALRNAQTRAESLQKAVDLYQNSVNVLETSEERSKIEISQQRQTISNLQEALVASKHQLNQLQQKSSSEVSLGWASRWLGGSSSSLPANTNNNNNKSVHDV